MNTMKKCSACGELYSGDLCPKCLASFAQKSSGPAPAQADLPLKPGQTFHGLEILEVLGRGGMGIVYKARQPALDRLVALKILPQAMAQDPDFQGRFIREARALGSLNHPNLVAVYDFGVEDGLFFFAMEFVDGTNLRSVLREGKLGADQALRIVPQLCDALEYAHAEGVVHRDIKPENILLDKKGRVKIADFGLAKLVGADAPVNLTMTNMVMGTPHYMAPEQVENPKSVDHRADIYALGVVFYEMLTGELPIGRFDLPSKKVQIDVRLDEVVLRTLEKRPTARYQKASDVKDAVTKATAIAGPSHESYAPTVMTPRPETKARIRSWIPVAAAAGLGALLGLLLLFRSTPPALRASVTAPTPAPAAPLDLSPLHFGPDERPARYVFAQPDKSLPRNPFPAQDEDEVQQLCKIMDEVGLQNVSHKEVRQGYACAWFRWNAAFIALDTPLAERLEKQFLGLGNLANKWTHRKGPLLVLAWAPRADSREVFQDLVARLQKKLGLPAIAPDVPLGNLKLDRSDLPSGWRFQEPLPPIAGRPGLRDQYQASFEPEEGSGQVEVRAWLADSDAAARAFEAAALDFKDRRKVDLVRTGNTVAGVALRGDDFGAFAKTVIRLRRAMGVEERRFEDLKPGGAELPAGFTIEREETQPAKVLEVLGVQGILSSEVRRAALLKLKPAGQLALLEAAESSTRSKIEEQLRKNGPAWSGDEWIFAVEAPDDESLDALENRLRELYGWDRKSPRHITLVNARLQESELPAGWTLGPAKADRWTYEGTLKGPAGELAYRILETRDYQLLAKKAAELPSRAGDLVIIKDTVICFIGGPEPAWPVLEELEAKLRKKMRVGPARAADFEIEPRELPSGTSLLARPDAGFAPNPQEPKGGAAVRKLLDSRLGADLAGATAAWACLVDPGETLVAFLQASDEGTAEALAARLRQAKAKHLQVFRKGLFVGAVRSDRQDGTEFQAMREVVRAKLRLPK